MNGSELTSLQEVIPSLSNTRNIQLCVNHINGVMVSMLMPSAVDDMFKPGSSQTKDKLLFVASPLSTLVKGVNAKTSWLGIMIMCPEWSNANPWTVVSVS